MFNPRVKCGLSALICALMITFTFIATATRFNPAFVRTSIDSLTAELSRETGRAVKAVLRDSEGQLVLEVKYSPRDELYLDTVECLKEMQDLMELAAIKYRGFADEVSVNAIASASVPLLEGIPEARNVTQTVTELRRRFDRKQILESGGRRWPKGDTVAYRDWTHIVVHHSGGPSGSAAAFDRWHRQRKWDGLGYNFVIGNGNGSRDGQIEAGKRWLEQSKGAHALTPDHYYNEHGVGICLVGDFTTDSERAGTKKVAPRKPGDPVQPSQRQRESLRFLVLYLCLRLEIDVDKVIGHCEVESAHTLCPGGNFSLERFRRDIRRDLQRLRQAEE